MSQQRGFRSQQVRSFLILLLLLLLAFGLRAGSLTGQSLWRDEVDALCYAAEFPRLIAQSLNAEVAAADPSLPGACPSLPPIAEGQSGSPWQRLVRTLNGIIHHNGPLYFLTLQGWITLAGHSVYALRFFALWFGVLVTPLVYVLGTRMLDRTAGYAAALLSAASPYLVWYGQEVKMYTLLPALTLLSLYALQRAMEGGRWYWWAAQALAASLALYIHTWSALLIVVQVIWLAVRWPLWRRRWGAALVSLAVLAIAYWPLASWQAPSALTSRETGFPHHTLGEMALILINGWSTGIKGWGWPLGQAVCGGTALLGVLTIIHPTFSEGRYARQSLLRLIVWLTVPLLGVWLVSLRQPLFTDRYLIWTAPAYYLLAGAGLMFQWRRTRWFVAVVLAAILVIFGQNLWTQAVVPIKADVRAAAAAVEEQYQPGDLLIFQIPHIRYTFDYYFGPQDYAWADGLYTNYQDAGGGYVTSEEVTGLQMEQVVRGYRTVWLIAEEPGMWDARDLVHQWLEENMVEAEHDPFYMVDVYRYRTR